MSFYTDPAFFLLCLPIVGVAFGLGVFERSLRGWGFVSSIAMLFLLFSKTPSQLGFALGFFVLSWVLFRLCLHWFVGSATVSRPNPSPHGSNEIGEAHALEKARDAKDAANQSVQEAESDKTPRANADSATGTPVSNSSSPDPRAVTKYRVALVVQLLPLVVYKLSEPWGANLFGFLGISYISFKACQVLIEIRDGLITQMKTIDYLAFLAFFPTFTSGPILRSRPFVEELGAPQSRERYLETFYTGCGWFLLGALYKFVFAALANWLMWFWPEAIGSATPSAVIANELAYAFAYGLYLFFDFAGYSALAMGVGHALGLRVPRNFHAPFLATDILDFWNRWHMTLSFWLRDFVFMRFVAFEIRHHWFHSRIGRACLGFMVNMTLMGLWHGVSWSYLVYGLYEGALLALCEVVQKRQTFYKRHRKQPLFKLISWAVTMIAVFFGFSLFNAQVASWFG